MFIVKRGKKRCRQPHGTQFFRRKKFFCNKIILSNIHVPRTGIRGPQRETEQIVFLVERRTTSYITKAREKPR